ncbi:MAG: hypothetical protein ACD_79C00697G0001 [uncultured bacterium]|nr:MAG: hypothetical protein ACD_79C00697G0001 [uncultured bacterium]
MRLTPEFKRSATSLVKNINAFADILKFALSTSCPAPASFTSIGNNPI